MKKETSQAALIRQLLAAVQASVQWIDPDEHGLVNRDEARAVVAQCEAAIAAATEALAVVKDRP